MEHAQNCIEVTDNPAGLPALALTRLAIPHCPQVMLESTPVLVKPDLGCCNRYIVSVSVKECLRVICRDVKRKHDICEHRDGRHEHTQK